MGLCVPTLNAGAGWDAWLEATREAAEGYRFLVIDSTSDDATADLARAAGCELHRVARRDFDHGGTRGWALELLADCDIVIFVTQDALVSSPETFARIIQTFDDPSIGAAYGRQLPYSWATPVAAHARLFNYPADSHTMAAEDVARYGIRAAFLSNSFTAYRREALMEVGGFPNGTILSEDMIAGARLLKKGWRLHYCAEAQVYHSHNYSLFQEFRRYFDIGVLHANEPWLLEMTGRAEGEGRRFILSEARYLMQHAPWLLPLATVRNGLKYLGYSLGRRHHLLPKRCKPGLSMHAAYWRRNA
ncbi:glycosyltransferase [Salinicola sp. JS01]|uniref:glycosyltransferase n=1 Tax=Salinicola sp. JS01 TaxID=3050071 RepID=UPI00255B7CC2|nr:glycosyltransferase [Salinicola sp. JS01]WIX33791.1 glycosyltransferase [Salinicola sp. JS01]